ncbi:hypothetical protein M9Y10_008533 [Tritrichomonas musculus]|uniref:UDENN domain-containing protein n=1 Tax=Tritrichomonas musculus TaxID=1915356 RepID=A0ABR2IYG4_9EUKA
MKKQVKKPISLIDCLAKFTAEDGRQWSEWEPSNPLFEKFFILGPKSFDANDEEISVLYECPEKCASDLSVQQFLFIEDVKLPDISFPSNFQKEGYFCTVNTIYDKAIFFKNDTGTPIYIYCLRFIASPFTRPSQLTNDNVFIELENYRNSEKIPQKLFALCIESSHPFYKLYFMILKRILQFEAKSRISAQNLYTGYDSFNDIQHDMLWPNSSYIVRESFLQQLQTMLLPCYNEQLIIYSNGVQDITFRMPPIEDVSFSIALWSYKPLLKWIKLEDFLNLVSAILLEQSIVIIGSKQEDIIKAAAFLPQLISPFLWVFPFISILPSNLLEMLNSPMSSIIGMLCSLKNYIPSDFIIIDLDDHKITFPNAIPKLPYHKELKTELNKNSYLFKRKKDSLSKKSTLELLNILKKFIQEKISNPVIKSILTNLASDENEGSMFVSQLYFKFFKEKYHPFIQKLIHTQLFNAFKEQNCRNKTRLNQSQDFADLSYNQWYQKFCPQEPE